VVDGRDIAYVGGRFMDPAEASVSIDDRGYQFGDGIYEVIRMHNGVPFGMKEHLQRLAHSAAGIGLELDRGLAEIEALLLETGRRTGYNDIQFYLSITRGVLPRQHDMPSEPIPPVTVIVARELKLRDPARYTQGVGAIIHPDLRWRRADIKSLNLLANILAKDAAVRRGCYEAILVDADGLINEASAHNVFAVLGGVLRTPPKSRNILHGITRQFIIDWAPGLGIAVEEETFTPEELHRADEVFVTGTRDDALAIVHIDGKPVGDGRPGPVTLKLHDHFRGRYGTC